MAMHPLKAGGGQAGVDGDDLLEGGFQGVDMLNARQQRLFAASVCRQIAPGRRTAALLLRVSDCCWINRWL
jgi:hypothetical protein